MKFTKEHRHEIYKLAYKIYLEDITAFQNTNIPVDGMCNCVIRCVYAIYGIEMGLKDLMNFKELYSLKPEPTKINNYWWNRYDYKIRKEKFKEIIEMTK